MKATELMKTRRTIRKFQDREILREDLLEMIECARLAPSAANLQPLKYFVISNLELCEKVFECTAWAGYLKGAGTPREGERPMAYIVILSDSEIQSARFEADGGAAAMSIILAAQERGIASCWIGSVKKDKLFEHLEIDDKYKLFGVMALGYPAEESVAEDFSEDIKYYKDEMGILHVPKRSIDDIIVNFK